jgi:hypothetical protein
MFVNDYGIGATSGTYLSTSAANALNDAVKRQLQLWQKYTEQVDLIQAPLAVRDALKKAMNVTKGTNAGALSAIVASHDAGKQEWYKVREDHFYTWRHDVWAAEKAIEDAIKQYGTTERLVPIDSYREVTIEVASAPGTVVPPSMIMRGKGALSKIPMVAWVAGGAIVVGLGALFFTKKKS